MAEWEVGEVRPVWSKLIELKVKRIIQAFPQGGFHQDVQAFAKPEKPCMIGADLKAAPMVFGVGGDELAGFVPVSVCSLCRACLMDYEGLKAKAEAANGEK
jgi:hypothetical protein